MTELWWRNPKPYVGLLREVYTQVLTLWDVSYIYHHHISVFSYMKMNFGINGDWKFMIVDPLDRSAKMYDSKNSIIGEYPLWNAKEDPIDDLISYMENPKNQDDHRILLMDFDVVSNREQVFEISQIQKDNPEILFHVFNSTSFGLMFGKGFYSADYNPTLRSGLGVIDLPSGKQIAAFKAGELTEGLFDASFWVKSLGFNPMHMTDRSTRIKFNIISGAWAAENFTKLPQISAIRYIPIESTVGREVLKKNTPLVKTQLPILEADKKACDFCSLWNTCRYYREGSVCTLPDSDYKDIAANLGTRDAFAIANGISSLLKINVERIAEARAAEAQAAKIKKQFISDVADEDEERAVILLAKGKSGSVDPDLTKLIDSTVKAGISLANLYKVSDGNQKVVIQVSGGSSGSDMTATPAITRELAARAVAEIEAGGISREDITEDHVNKWMAENVIAGELE